MCELKHIKYYTLICRIAIQRVSYYIRSCLEQTLICISISVTRMCVHIKHIHTPTNLNILIIIISSWDSTAGRRSFPCPSIAKSSLYSILLTNIHLSHLSEMSLVWATVILSAFPCVFTISIYLYFIFNLSIS